MGVYPLFSFYIIIMIIYDENMIRQFFEAIFPHEWNSNEVAFVSLAARKKYLKDKNINLGHRPEMLDKEVVKTFDSDYYVSRIRRFETEGYLDESNIPIPDEAKAVYVNIHLSDVTRSWIKTKDEMNKVELESLSHLITHQPDISHVMRMMKNLPNIWFSQIQNTYSRKFWIDIDVDIEDPNQVWTDKKTLREVLAENILSQSLIKELKNTIIIHTRGGFHILINCRENQFDKRINPETIRESIEYQVVDFAKEVVINKNGMVPCPGTYQGGYSVWMMNIN